MSLSHDMKSRAINFKGAGKRHKWSKTAKPKD